MHLSDEEIGDLVSVFQLLGDGVRVRILLLLAAGGELSVGRLCSELGKRQPTVSHHLALLRAGSLVSTRRDGRNIYYSLGSQGDGGGGGGADERSLCAVKVAARCLQVCEGASDRTCGRGRVLRGAVTLGEPVVEAHGLGMGAPKIR